MNPIKALAHRFVSLPPLVRMRVTKKLLELYSSDQAAREAGQFKGSSRSLPGKSFLEQFWDEVENAHGDRPLAVNPFTQERKSREPGVKAVDAPEEQDGYLPWRIPPINLFALL
jgi:VanZ family protein